MASTTKKQTPPQFGHYKLLSVLGVGGYARVYRAQDTDAFHEVNMVFHGKLVEFTGNPRLMAVDEGIGKELRLFLWRGLFGASRLRVSNLQHREILDAIIEGDEEKAGSAFERHVIMGKQRMLDNVIGNSGR